jgi:hypothetical protein
MENTENSFNLNFPIVKNVEPKLISDYILPIRTLFPPENIEPPDK